MATETTDSKEYSTDSAKLYLAIELGKQEWKLGFTIGLGQRPRVRAIDGGDLAALQWEIGQAKRRFGLRQEMSLMSCYAAGRDGFWLHRYLVASEVENLVVDSSSIEVKRRARRVKTDRLDVQKLLTMLIRYDSGERKVWSVVHVPSVEAEDKRHLHRQLSILKTDRTRHINRIKGLLHGQGVRIPVKSDFLEKLETVRLWDGSPLSPGLGEPRTGYAPRAALDEISDTLNHVRLLLEEIEYCGNSSQKSNDTHHKPSDLSDTFVTSIKKAAKPGIALD